MERATLRRHSANSGEDYHRRGGTDRGVIRTRAPTRKGITLRLRRETLLYAGIICVAFLLLGLGIWQLNWLNVSSAWPAWGDGGGGGGDGTDSLVLRSMFWFVTSIDLQRKLSDGQAELDRRRSGPQFGVRPPRIALVLGNLSNDSESLKLLTIVKSLQDLGYKFTVFSLEEGNAHYWWKQIGYQVSVFGAKSAGNVDWSIYDGVIGSSLEFKSIISSSLMQEPFSSVPLVWLIQEDILGKRLPEYVRMGWQDLLDEWKSAFNRAEIVVFPDYSLPMVYTLLDSGNFYVISGSPVDTLIAGKYESLQSRFKLRKNYGFHEDDTLILFIGSYFYYEDLPWEYAASIKSLASNIGKIENLKVLEGRLKFIFLCGNCTEAHASIFQELASLMHFPADSLKYYDSHVDVNGLILMADTVIYASFQEEQSFPPLLIRAMSFGIPIVAPDLSVIKKYVVDEVNGFIFHPNVPESLNKAFKLLISDKKLSYLANVVASNAKLLARNIFASECIDNYAVLLERVLQFPSEVMLPSSVTAIHQKSWLWDLFERENIQAGSVIQHENSSNVETHTSGIVLAIEEHYTGNTHMVKKRVPLEEYPTQQDWIDLNEMETYEDYERREMLELEERTEQTVGSWEDVYRNARKAEKQKTDGNEREEGELERTGQNLCIYEIYNGEGSWQFLHHGSLYRGLSLSRRDRRSKSDDVDAVGRLPILDDPYYSDLLCEFGAMFSIANQVDSIHKIPWIGFQSWRATGKEVSLSADAANALEEAIQLQSIGEVVFYWALTDAGHKNRSVEINKDFWSTCDTLNARNCREIFETAFKHMYNLPQILNALPPMPYDGDSWSALHSWVMPTPSFLEFIMFSRMFVDSLDIVIQNTSKPSSCIVGSSKIEKRHCYCRILEILVNVWAYHSARKMVYINPLSGECIEQHPVEQRKDVMWIKYFDFALLKGMDEDLAEEADDAITVRDGWLWPLTGEVHWQGVFEREREDRYRQKMDKKRKTKEKILDRQKHGYKQKSLGG